MDPGARICIGQLGKARPDFHAFPLRRGERLALRGAAGILVKRIHVHRRHQAITLPEIRRLACRHRARHILPRHGGALRRRGPMRRRAILAANARA